MKYFVLVLSMLVFMSGCVSSGGQWGRDSVGGFGAGSAKNNNPSQKVDSGQIAARDIGPYGAALGVGSIVDPQARKDAKETIQTVSENQNMLWGNGRSVFNGNGLAPTIAGSQLATGLIENSFDYPVNIQIVGVGPIYRLVGGETLEVSLPNGRYRLVIYNDAGQLLGDEKFPTTGRVRHGDIIYDFLVLADGR